MNSLCHIPRSTPTRAIEIITGIKPLELEIEERALKTHMRIKNLVNLIDWDGENKLRKNRTGHIKHWSRIGETLGDTEGLETNVGKILNNKFNVNLRSLSGEKKYLTPFQYNIYTDGSKTKDGVGFGYQIYKYKTKLGSGYGKLQDWSTVFQAEVKAIEEAAGYMIGEDIKDGYVKIYTDSQATLQALCNRETRSKSVEDAKKLLNQLSNENKHVTVVWTRAHVGTEGNEEADKLAKKGAAEGNWYCTYRPNSNLAMSVEKRMYEKWQSEWDGYKEGRMSKQFLKTIRKNIQQQALELGRHKLGTLIRIITGHNGLAYFKHKIDPEIDPVCRFCQEDDETFHHFINDCPVFWRERMEVIGNDGLICEWDVNMLMQFASFTKIAMALEGIAGIWYEEIIPVSDENRPPPEPD
jgi:ribonuclease HI